MASQQFQCKNNAEKNPVSDEQGKFNIQLKDIHSRLTDIEKKVDETLENTRILKAKADAILRQTFELAEFTVPRLFIVLPDDTPRYNPAHWFHLNYRLYFLCECENDNERHFAFHEGYKIKQPREFLRRYGPYLRKMLTVVKCAVSLGSLIAPQLSHIAPEMPNSAIPKDPFYWYNSNTRIERLGEILIEAEKSLHTSTEKNLQYVEGAELREIQSFFKKVDAYYTLGNLFRSVTKDGHVRWVCIQHYEKHYSDGVIKGLHEDFQKIGGEIKGDAVIIQRKTSNKVSELLDVLCRGLPVSSVILKDLKINEEDFNKLLSYVSQQPVIRDLEIENITVRSYPFDIKEPDIISKLEDIVIENNKINVQYSFTKSLSKFTLKLIDAIKETHQRLVFRVQSQENTPALKLIGTHKTGFVLYINNNTEKDHNSYYEAIRTDFKVPNITKILFHSRVIFEYIWTTFYEFLNTSQTLQELTVDCCLTIKQTEALSSNLCDNTTLTTLYMFNVWEKKDESNGCEEIFKMLQVNPVIIKFTLKCYTDQLQLDSIAKYLLQNKSLRVLRLPKCMVNENTNIKVIEDFLQTTSIQKLTLELTTISSCESFLERLARVVDNNETLEVVALKGISCSAIFHRQKQIYDNADNAVCSAPVKSSKPTFQSQFRRFSALFSCHDDKYHRQTHGRIVHSPVILRQEDNGKSVSAEPFYKLCDHPSFYKQMQEIAQNFKLEELHVNVATHVEMSNVASSMKPNLTVTRLRIGRRILTQNDIQMLLHGLRDNTTIIHLSLNEIIMSITYLLQIFDVLRDDQTLRILDISHCINHSGRDLFAQEVKKLELDNPLLKVVYENQ